MNVVSSTLEEDNMIEKEYILKLLYIAFLEIRVASHKQDSRTCFMLSDIFHNVPLQINTADKGNADYAAIVKRIREKCEQRNYISWLDNATADISRRP